MKYAMIKFWIVFIILIYTLGAFMAWDLNPAHWAEAGRVVFGITIGIVGFVSIYTELTLLADNKYDL